MPEMKNNQIGACSGKVLRSGSLVRSRGGQRSRVPSRRSRATPHVARPPGRDRSCAEPCAGDPRPALTIDVELCAITSHALLELDSPGALVRLPWSNWIR